MFTTPQKQQQQPATGVDPDMDWYVPPTPPQQQQLPHASSSSSTDAYHDRVSKLKEQLDATADQHHLLSVIATTNGTGPPLSTNGPPSTPTSNPFPQMASSFSSFLKTNTPTRFSSTSDASFSASTTTSTIIPPISFKDFDSFLQRARSKTGKQPFAGATPHKEFIPSKPIAAQSQHALPQEEMLRECYSKVGEEFFERSFDLYENNATIDDFIEQSFALLRDRGDAASASSPQEAITKLRVRSEQILSGQLDLVETCLFNETMTRKDAIFQTIANLQDLQLTVREESQRVHQLRLSMAELKNVTTTGSVEVLALQAKTDAAHSLLVLLDKISHAKAQAAKLDVLLKANDHTGAFMLIEDTLGDLEAPSEQLSAVFALRTMTRQFREFKETTGNAMSESFLRAATGDMFPTTASASAGGSATALTTDQEMAQKLMPWLRGMLKRGNARPCINLYKLEMQRTLKSTNEIVIVSFFNSRQRGTQQGSSLVSANLAAEADKRLKEVRLLPQADFTVLAQHLFESVDAVLLRARQVDVCLVQHIFAVLVETEQLSHRDCAELTTFSRDCLQQITKTAHEQLARVLQVRADYHQTKLTPQQFHAQVFVLFGQDRGQACAQVVHTQLEQFVSTWHDRMQKQLVHQLDEKETWDAVASVPGEVQAICARIENTSSSDLFAEEAGGVVMEVLSDEESKYLCVGQRKLRVLQSALDLVRMVQDYLRLASISQQVAWMCVGRLFDLVVLFDERVRRLILGTEVKQRKRLAVIGAKNLALTLQSLVAVHLLLPSIATRCLAAVKPEMANRVRDELVQRMDKALADHETALVDTLRLLVTMELNRLAKQLTEAGGIDWDAKGTEGLDSAQEYMVTFAGKIDRLYSVLVVNLDRESLVLVFTRVLKLVDERIVEMYGVVSPTTPAGKMRVKVDILHLVGSLRKLKFLQGLPGLAPGNALEDWVNDRYRPLLARRTSAASSDTAAPSSRRGSLAE